MNGTSKHELHYIHIRFMVKRVIKDKVRDIFVADYVP